MREAWKRNGYDGEPPTVNLADYREAIQTGAELNRIVEQWRRFSERTNPGSTRPVEYNGHIVPAQMVKEARYKVIRENKLRKRMLYEIHPEFDGYEPWEQATALANKNLHKVTKIDNPLEELSRELMMTDRSYAARYTETLRDVAGSDPEIDAIAEAILDMNDDNPALMRSIFENSKYDEVLNIDFIYKPDKSADRTPWEDTEENGMTLSGKRSRIIRFWKDKIRDYL